MRDVKLWWGEAVQRRELAAPHRLVHAHPRHPRHAVLRPPPARRAAWPVGTRAFIALLVEASWEVVENTPMIMDRYRDGDDVARLFRRQRHQFDERHPRDAGRLLAGLEAAGVGEHCVRRGHRDDLAPIIRDNLTLNMMMLISPVPAVLEWQAGK